MKWYNAAICSVALYTTAVSADQAPPQTPSPGWVCIARTAVLQKAYSGSGPSEPEARAAALTAYEATTPIGCYIERCDKTP